MLLTVVEWTGRSRSRKYCNLGPEEELWWLTACDQDDILKGAQLYPICLDIVMLSCCKTRFVEYKY